MPRRPLPLILARELAANVATPYLVLDGEGTLVFFNERAERIVGATPSELGEMPEASGAPASRSSGPTGAGPGRADALGACAARAPAGAGHARLHVGGRAADDAVGHGNAAAGRRRGAARGLHAVLGARPGVKATVRGCRRSGRVRPGYRSATARTRLPARDRRDPLPRRAGTGSRLIGSRVAAFPRPIHILLTHRTSTTSRAWGCRADRMPRRSAIWGLPSPVDTCGGSTTALRRRAFRCSSRRCRRRSSATIYRPRSSGSARLRCSPSRSRTAGRRSTCAYDDDAVAYSPTTSPTLASSRRRRSRAGGPARLAAEVGTLVHAPSLGARTGTAASARSVETRSASGRATHPECCFILPLHPDPLVRRGTRRAARRARPHNSS